jgi:hypothetical protein
VYVDDKILDGRLHVFRENTEVIVFASKTTRLDVNADKFSTWLCLEARMQNEDTT